MKNYLPLSLLFFALSLFAQEKGVSPINNQQPTTSNQHTYAVVVGISDYQDDDIPDLRFADKDAEAFAQYLQSPAGGSLPDENIKLLTNQNATMAAVAAELDWLVETCKEGDQAIIYFSGHGDVEAKTARQPGFLLTYDSPPKIYIAGAYPLFYLQLIVETLSSDKNVQTVIITDACRAGKLAGSEIGGTQATAANLAKQYANEIKILSCQPDEFSLEGEQWGGGRGAFSYHLIEGLIGLADKNGNGSVNLLELENYLETVVSEETDPQSQIPMTVGSKGTKIAEVDAGILVKLKDLKAKQLPTLAAIESRGFEETLLANADSSIQKKYEAFIAALEHKNLLDAKDGQPSADDLYRELMQEESLADLHRFMTRQFATALQDDAQQAINAYLLANPIELEKRWKGDTTYSHYPRYLGRAAELLGRGHYMHDYLIAKQLYFEGLNLRLEADRLKSSDSLYQIAVSKQEKALSLETRAAFFYNELGVLNTRLKNSDKAIECYEKAIAAAPEWGLPYVNYSVELFYSGQYDEAIAYGEKALKYLPEFPQMYHFLGWIYANDYDWLEKQNWTRKGLELSDDIYFPELNVNSLGQNRIRYERAVELLEKAKTVDPNYFLTFKNLGIVYWQLEEFEKAEANYLKAISLDSIEAITYLGLGRLYLGQRKTELGIAALLKGIELADNPDRAGHCYNSLAWGYDQKGDTDAAIAARYKAMELAPTFKYSHTNQANRFITLGKYEKAESILLDVLKTKASHLQTYLYLGRAYTLMNRQEDAEHIYLKGLEWKPDYTEILYALIRLYQNTGQIEKALEYQRSILQSEPDNVEHLANMEILYFHLGDLEKAEEYAKNVNDLVKDDHAFISQLAYQYLYAKHFEKAAHYFDNAEKADPTIVWNDWNWCCYYSIKGEPKKAIQSFEKALEKGFRDFNHIYTDVDATNMRKEPEFEMLMEKYFPGQVYEGKPATAKNSEPIYYRENCLLLADFYESEGEHERAEFLREQAAQIKK